MAEPTTEPKMCPLLAMGVYAAPTGPGTGAGRRLAMRCQREECEWFAFDVEKGTHGCAVPALASTLTAIWREM